MLYKFTVYMHRLVYATDHAIGKKFFNIPVTIKLSASKFSIFLTVHLRTILVGDQLDA